MSDKIELDVTDNPNWDLEIPLVMGAVERGALAHRIRAWGAQQFAAGKAAAQAVDNEAAFDKLLADPAPCSHNYEFDGHQGFKTVWRCSKCGTERVR